MTRFAPISTMHKLLFALCISTPLLVSCSKGTQVTDELALDAASYDAVNVNEALQRHIDEYRHQYVEAMVRIQKRLNNSQPQDNADIPEDNTALEEGFAAEYDATFNALLLTESLSTQQMNTVINLLTFLPESLNDETISKRIELKSPALYRLMKQHKVWQEIEEQQRIELQKLQRQRIEDNAKREEQLDKIVTEFKNKVKVYDEKIKKYEKQVKKVQSN